MYDAHIGELMQFFKGFLKPVIKQKKTKNITQDVCLIS